ALRPARVRACLRRGRARARQGRGRCRIPPVQEARRSRRARFPRRRLPGGPRMKTVACLAGDGVGPELMAAATRALDRVAKLHGLELDDRHFPFGGEAVTRSGHPLPAATRSGYRDVDAILVASPNEPALDGVKADLH